MGGKVRRGLLLVPPNFSKGDGTGPVPVGLLYSSRGLRGGLSSSLGSDYTTKNRIEAEGEGEVRKRI